MKKNILTLTEVDLNVNENHNVDPDEYKYDIQDIDINENHNVDPDEYKYDIQDIDINENHNVDPDYCYPSEVLDEESLSNYKEKKLILKDKLEDQDYRFNKLDKIREKGELIYNDKLIIYSANEEAKFKIAHNEQNKILQIEHDGEILLDKINNNSETCLWKYKKSYYYRSARGNEIYRGDKKEICEIMENFLKEPIKIISIQDIQKKNTIESNLIHKYILTYQIPVIEHEIFEPKEKEFFEKNGVLYKNLFVYTDYLNKRFDSKEKIENYDCFIIDFFENISNEVNEKDNYKPVTKAILDWLSCFFKKMESSNITLVLHGSKEIAEDIFWKKIIKPIFGNEEYCVVIDDSMLEKPISKIVENKIFFHLGDFVTTEDNKKKVNQLLQGILIDKYVLSDSNPPQRIPVYGQLLITAEETISYMRKFHTQFEYINIENESEVITNLAENIIELSFRIEDNLDMFSTYLITLCQDETKRLTVVSKMKEENISESLEDKIQKFIQAIKSKNIDYFEKVKDINSGTTYEHMENAFNKDEGYFINQYLFDCYNSIYANQPFAKKIHFTEKLKEKDDMFKQEVKTLKILDKDKNEQVLFQSYKTSKETGNKELYKIKDYKLAEEIKIPDGATVISSQDNIRKYAFENDDDIDKCITRTKEYRAEKTKEKDEKSVSQ